MTHTFTLGNWGATPAERVMVLPGDEFVPDPATTVTRAIGIAAPPREVWPWLVQIGYGRGGMYSYDRLENLCGLDIHSTNEIRDEWQSLAVGDRVVLVPEGWMGMAAGYSLPVAALQQDSFLVLRQAPPEHPWDAAWSFVLLPDGERRCRLLSRSRAARPTGRAGLPMRAVTATMEPINGLMIRRMLIGIKNRAELSYSLAPVG